MEIIIYLQTKIQRSLQYLPTGIGNVGGMVVDGGGASAIANRP